MSCPTKATAITLMLALTCPSPVRPALIVSAPSQTTLHEVGVADFKLGIGKPGNEGIEVDYRRDRPGYAVAGLQHPLLLQPGAYRASFIVRRGHYPNKGLLNKTYPVFRLELWDLNTKALVISRELQMSDFSSPNRYERRWMEFSMEGREGHLIEPRVYWLGLANGEIESIEIDRFRDVSDKELEQKAFRIGQAIERDHLENGFVVSRSPEGLPEETGDAITYTGFYVVSLAWKYAVTKDELTYQALESGIQTLHNAIKGTYEEPVVTRFVDAHGNPFPKPPSKDVYTAFFLAYSIAYPHIQNPALKKQMRSDLERIGNKFLREDLTLKGGDRILLSLPPHFTEAEVRLGIRELFKDKKLSRKIVKYLKRAKRYLPFGEPLPGRNQIIRAINNKDEEALYKLVVPTLNGATDLVERVRDILLEQYRNDLFPRRYRNGDYPGKKLAELLTDTLKKLPAKKDGRRFRHISDLKVLASNAAIVLHMVRTAQLITKRAQFEDYYRSNLYTQDALLKTALDWYSFEEDITRLAAGNATADRARRGYLTALALYNLIELETNPTLKDRYQDLMRRWWSNYRHEDNPMAMAFAHVCLGKTNGVVELIRRDLAFYAEDRKGFGPSFWAEKGTEIAEKLGGGLNEGYSREPLPVSIRPRDSFLWQRSARRLKGDYDRTYPGTDYLFLYWFCRYHRIIPPPSAEPTVQR